MALLRYAAICALDLVTKLLNIDNSILFLELKLKVIYSYHGGGAWNAWSSVFILRFSNSAANSTSGVSGLLDGIKSTNEHMQKKGGAAFNGVAPYRLKMGDICDLVKIIRPGLPTAKQVQENDNWGENWVARLEVELELASK
ncbi:hypothetical protein BDZ89DRAFT_1129655 [Hymenopellis radicata]|nr:hypothetical protein BDZ89DRAFT_1129655 [Hymenopellis radicata]